MNIKKHVFEDSMRSILRVYKDIPEEFNYPQIGEQIQFEGNENLYEIVNIRHIENNKTIYFLNLV